VLATILQPTYENDEACYRVELHALEEVDPAAAAIFGTIETHSEADCHIRIETHSEADCLVKTLWAAPGGAFRVGQLVQLVDGAHDDAHDAHDNAHDAHDNAHDGARMQAGLDARGRGARLARVCGTEAHGGTLWYLCRLVRDGWGLWDP
jgi:hypothetical protein